MVYSFIFKVSKRFSLWLVMLTLAALLPASLSSSTAQAADPPAIQGWQDTGIDLTNTSIYNYCFDATQPDTLLVPATQSESPYGILGTYTYNLNTGLKTLLSSNNFENCNSSTGQLYRPNSYKQAPALIYMPDTGAVFSSREPTERIIAHYPTHFAQDGTLLLYSVTKNSANDWRLYASRDNGYSWDERAQPFINGAVDVHLVVSPADARSIYLMGVYGNASVKFSKKYAIYFSPDAGATWEKRLEKVYDTESDTLYIGILPVEGRTTPVNTLQFDILDRSGAANGSFSYLVSNDGARTFTEVGATGRGGTFGLLVHSNEGLVRKKAGVVSLELSADGGKNWQPLTMPSDYTSDGPIIQPNLFIFPVPNAPNNIVLSDSKGDNTWLSSDGARSWRKIGTGILPQFISPYLPLTIVGRKDNKLYKLNVADVGKSMTSAALPSGAAGSNYYPETRHNLSGIFKKFWEANGGLAQFGYPKTEPFREYNPADGKVYLAQYFERNRFEYHPDLAGTPYEVLLGLLGNQLTADRKAKGDGAFNYFADMHYPGGRYFPETGHNLRNSFKAYWETNGGLSIYGNPTSEEFYEVNPDDGKTYVVQYFERNRMEWHPENKGTRYEVLLGLLGNTLLQQKGWL